MSAIVIEYARLEDAATCIKELGKNLDRYHDEMKKAVDTLNKTSGTDNYGYVGTALDLAKKKMNRASQENSSYSQYGKKLENFITVAKEQDKIASDGISQTIAGYVGERSFFQKIGDAFYEGYVNFLDRLEGTGPVGKKIAQLIRKGADELSHFKEKALNWFKYGDGQYVLNILDAAKDVLLAVGVFVAAVAAAVTAPAWAAVLAVVTVVAAGVYLMCQFVDSAKQIEENNKALSLSGDAFEYGDGNTTAARYYGEIDGFESYTQHYDFGGKTANNVIETLGTAEKYVKNTSKTVAKVGTFVLTFAAGGTVEGADGKERFELGRAVKAQFFKTANGGGYYGNDYQTGGFDAKKGLNVGGKMFSSKNMKTLTKLGMTETAKGKIVGGILDGAKTFDNFEKINEVISYTNGSSKTAYETVEKVMTVGGFVPAFDAVFGDAWKQVSGVKGWIDFFGKEESTNPYSSILCGAASGGGGYK